MPFYDMPVTTPLRLLRYPPHPSAALANQLGAARNPTGAAHLLVQDDLGGLEAQTSEGPLCAATPVPGLRGHSATYAALGPTAYRSNMHRVTNNISSRDRYSRVLLQPRPRLAASSALRPSASRAPAEVSALHRFSEHTY